MTGGTHGRGPMRHIPEEELHAYLDQALSRSQCVEIESHLAACPSCRALRDGIAALRDRTTALLARLAPPRRVPMSFEALRHQGDLRASIRRRRIRAAAWAASLVLAVGTGWAAAALSRPEASRAVAQGAGAAAPQQTVAVVETPPALSPANAADSAPQANPRTRRVERPAPLQARARS